MPVLECTRDGISCGSFPLLEGAAIRLGRGDEADIRLQGESYLSRLHVELSFEGGRLRVRKLPQASNPVFHGGMEKDDIRLEPGDFFTIGSTRLRFIADAAPPGLRPAAAPLSRRTMEQAEVYAVSDRMRLKDLLELPEILQSKERNEFYLHIAAMLRMATGAAWAAVLSGDRRILGQLSRCAG